jgi:hypothetical protein
MKKDTSSDNPSLAHFLAPLDVFHLQPSKTAPQMHSRPHTHASYPLSVILLNLETLFVMTSLSPCPTIINSFPLRCCFRF